MFKFKTNGKLCSNSLIVEKKISTDTEPGSMVCLGREIPFFHQFTLFKLLKVLKILFII